MKQVPPIPHGGFRIFRLGNKMKRSLSRLSRRSPLAVVLISIALAATLITFVVSASKNTTSSTSASPVNHAQAARWTKPLTRIANRRTLTPVAPMFAPTITATLADDITLVNKKNPGDTITYTAVISNTGSDASNVVYTDILDNNTTLVGGSVKTTPIAFDDAYIVVGNVRIQPNAAAGLLVNDIDPDTGNNTGLTATAQTISSTQCAACGNVAINADGSFSYNPPVGFQGSDTFTYIVNDPTGKTGTGTVTLTVSGIVWFVNNNAAACTTLTLASGCGRLTNPFSTLAAFQGFNDGGAGPPTHPKINDNIFIFESASNYIGPVTLLSGQRLFGQDSTTSLQTLTGLTPQAYSDPFPAMNSGNGTFTAITSAGVAINLNNTSTSNNLNGFTVGNSTTGINGSSFGTLNVGSVVINTNGQALVLSTGTVSTPANYAGFTSTTSTGGTNNVSLTTIAGTVNLGSGALSAATGDSFFVSGGAASINYSGTIASGSAHSVNIGSKTGGTVALSGLVTDTDTGITLTSNTGATINFTGGISASTTTNAAFNATGGGTVSATQDNTTIVNTISTTTGTSLNINNTTIGASNITFRSITAGTGAGSAGNGIVLDATGSSGGLVVTGNSGAATGGTIQHKTGADGSTAGGIGIYLNSTSNVSLTQMQLNDFDNFGIRGTTVTGFTMTNTNISGTNGTNDAFDEAPIAFTNLLGTAAITGGTFSGSVEDTFRVINNTGTLNRIVISGTTFGTMSNVTGGDGVLLQSAGTAILNATIQNSFFTNARSDLIQTDVPAGTNNKLDLIFTGNTLTNNNAGVASGGGGTTFSTTGLAGSAFTYNISNNTFRDADGAALAVSGGNPGCSSNGKIENNTIGVAGVANSGSKAGSDIAWVMAGGGTHIVRIANNTLFQYNNHAILLQLGDQMGNAQSGQATVTGNTANTPGTINTDFNGIHLNHGTVGTDNFSSCIDIGGAGALKNTVVGKGTISPNNNDIRLRQRQSTTVSLPGYGGANSDNAAVQAYLAGRNTVTTTAASNTVPTGGGFTGGAGCTQPPIANPDGGDSAEETQATNKTPTDGQSNASPSTFAWLKQILHPVASFAAKLNFLQTREVPMTPALTPAEKSAAIAGVNGISATQETDDKNVTPQVGGTVTVAGSGTGFTLPAGKTITITYQATVNSPPLAKSVSTQGHVTFTGGPGGGVPTDDPETGAAGDATVTNIETSITWTGATSTDWNDMTNWNLPGPVVSSYAPGVSNPAVNDVIIPSGALPNEPNIGTTDINIYSLNVGTGRTLTITSPRILTMGGAPGGNLILDGIISGGEFRFGTGTHTITNTGGTGSFSSTNLTQVLSGSTVTLNNNLQMGALNINAGGSMDITNRILSLNGPGAALTVGGTFTTVANGDGANPGAPPGDGLQAGGSTVVYNSTTGAQTGPGIAYTSLTINNSAGVTLTGDASLGAAGVLTLTSGDLNMGNTGQFTLTVPNTLATLPANGTFDVIGSFKRTGAPLSSGVALTFGNSNNQITLTGSTLTSLTVNLTKATPTAAFTGIANSGWPGSIQRTYLITPSAGAFTTSTLRLHYLDSELNAGVNPANTEGNLRLYKFVINSPSTGWQQQDPSGAVTTPDTTNNWVQKTAVTSFSPWTIAGASPTSATSTVSGRILDDNGNPVEGAVIRLNGTQDRKTITDASGNYAFSEVETNGFYTVTPSRVNYNFAPVTRGFSALGAHTEASFGAAFNGNHQNPLDTTEYFVRQQYVDFLGREPEEKGFNDWTDTINNCASGDASCDRIHVSEMFFRSEEFQQRGYFVYRFYSTAFGQKPDYAVFAPDLGRVSGFLDATHLEAAKTAFANDFTTRPAFINQYGTMTNAQYVDALAQTAGVTLSNRQTLVDGLEHGTLTRAQVLRQIADSGEVYARYYNQAFVVMEYFGYLRRDPDILYLNWISVLDANPADSRHMVEGFVDATEYRNRFTPTGNQ